MDLTRDGPQPPLWERGCATVEDTLIKIDIDAQRQRAVGWSDWLGRMGVMAELPQLPKSVIIKSVEWQDSERANQENRGEPK
jgi:hypothetical protein